MSQQTETEYLLSSTANAERLLESIAQLKAIKAERETSDESIETNLQTFANVEELIAKAAKRNNNDKP